MTYQVKNPGELLQTKQVSFLRDTTDPSFAEENNQCSALTIKPASTTPMTKVDLCSFLAREFGGSLIVRYTLPRHYRHYILTVKQICTYTVRRRSKYVRRVDSILNSS